MTYHLIAGDCLEVMKPMPAESVDLVITSPPYNLRNTTGGYLKARKDSAQYPRLLMREGYDQHEDCMPHGEYVEWQRAVLGELMRLLKPDGAIFYNHKWRVQGGLLQDRADIVAGFPVRQIIIWHKAGGFNHNPHYFTPAYEVIYMIAKPGFRLSSKAGLTDVWSFPAERDNDHPAPFPVALPERIIRSTDARMILDPFVGSGTTAVAAERAGRHCIGIDKSSHYLAKARARLECVGKMMM